MHDPFAEPEGAEDTAVVYAVLSIVTGYFCIFVGLLVFPFWVGVGFAIAAPVLLIITFAAFVVRGREARTGRPGTPEPMGAGKQAVVPRG